MMNRRIRETASAITFLLVASILTTCGDDSSSSKEDRGVYGEMADNLQSVEDTVLTSNAAVYASADYMLPYIETLLELNAHKIASQSGPTSCLTAGIGGRVYTINGEPFTSVVDPQLPEYTARFRLFRLSTAGQPLLDQDIGHIDYTCVDLGVPITEVQIYNDSILIASTTYSATSGNITGTLRSPDRAVSLLFFGEPQQQGHVYFSFLTTRYEVGAFSFVTEGGTSHITGVKVNDAPNGTAPEIFFEIDLSTNAASGQMADGHASYTEGPITRGAACILSGTIESPIFSPPSDACFTEVVQLLSINSAERAAMLEIYQSARAYWLRASAQAELCRSLVPPAQ